MTMPDKPASRRIPYFGDFALFGEIGRGGMGVVHNAQQTKLDRPVALKVLHSHLAHGEAGLQRLRIEAEAAARLDHPNIVPIYEIGEHEGQPYLAMQLVEGKSLAEYLGRFSVGLPEREAATLLAKIASAVHHAHQRGVLHRDLKPGNVLLDAGGEPRLIDFGLAKCVEQDSGLTQTGSFLGTPAYASPEQAAGHNKSITTASDIYSLGAILYALLTSQPPFVGESTAEIIDKVKSGVPPRPRSIRPALSANLETICLKCLKKEPARRYASAFELAEDLTCFLDGRPIAARPVGAIERLWMWIRRNPVHAALWMTAFLAVVASLVGGFLWRNTRAKETEARNQIRQRQLLEEIQATRLTAHSAGWSERAWTRAGEAAGIPTTVKSGDVRDQAAAILAGLDARRLKVFTNFGASSVAFDWEGKRLLMGGFGDGTKFWDAATDTIHISSRTNLGPVAFAENGAPLQLLCDAERHSLVLADVVHSQTVREWKIPPQFGSQPVTGETPLAITPDGSSIVAVLKSVDGHAALTAFLPGTVRLVASLSNSVAAMTLSPDGSLVAAAESTGKVSVWSVRDGRRVAEFTASRNEITSLALKHTTRVLESRERGTSEVWLLAAGDSGGIVTIWDLRTQTLSAYCRGGHYHVYAVAFSPDGMTLASGGRGPIKLWDVATGRLLLDVPSGDYITGLDFAPDGMRLAVSSQGTTYPANVSIWQLEFGRGIKTLRGLSGEVSKICFSADGRKFAALSHNWEVGVWDLAEGHLLRILEVPRGEYADNAALAFSPDGKRLAFSAWKAARMWEVQSGVELAAWELPPGLVETLGFPDENHLLLFRMETLDGRRAPLSDAPPKNHPRVCRIRDLLSIDARKPIAENDEFNWRVFTARAPHDGRTFIAEGLRVRGGERTVMIKSFDGLTGKELWTIPLTRNYESGVLVADATGNLVAYRRDKSTKAALVELASGAVLKTLDFVPTAMRHEPRLHAVGGYRSGQGVSLFDDTSVTPLITLGIDGVASNFVEFDPRGTQLAWGNADGTVTVCNLEEIRDRLSRSGLQW